MIEPAVALFTLGAVALGAISVPVVRAVHWALRIQGQRRNSVSRCARCGREWPMDAAEVANAHLVEGLLVCSSCTDRLRARTWWAEGALIGIIGTTAVILWGSGLSLYAQHVMALPKLTLLMLPPVLIAGTTLRYVARMRVQNRRALEALVRTRLLSGNGNDRKSADATSTGSEGIAG